MNTNPATKRILCFGDSNTWGLDPERLEKYPPSVRWTGVLQDTLGSEYEVLEEGLRSRTTNMDDPQIPDRNAMTYLRPCIESLAPIDICFVWLGTNDLKSRFNRQAPQITEGMEEVVAYLKENLESHARIVLVSPPDAWEVEHSAEWGFVGIEGQAQALRQQYHDLAQKYNIEYVDLIGAGIETSPIDGIHLSAETHTTIGHLFADKIKNAHKHS